MKQPARLLLSFIFALGLSACMTSEVANPSRVTPGDIVANVVRVDTSAFSGIEGRDLVVSREKVAKDISRAIGRRMDGRGPSNANIDVRLNSVRLTSPGSAFAFGGPSSIEARVTVTDVDTGEILFGPEVIRGTSEFVRLPGVIGVATSPTPERDYEQTVEGFSVAVRAAINGTDPEA